MDARNEELLKDKLNANNSKFSSKIEVSQNGRTLYFEIGNNV
jgi:hypothetical protein